MKFSLFSAALLASSIAQAATPIDGWYSSAFGGYTYFPNNISRTIHGFYFSRDAYDSGFNAGVRLGYQSYPLRYELEYTYMQANTKNFQVDRIRQFGISGKTDANLGMANIYFDFRDVILPTIYPFLGGGIGYAYVQTSLNSDGPFPLGGISFRVNSSTFAYQGTAGLTYNFSENFALNAAYRYVGTTSTNNFGKTFQAQNGDVGVIYRFDQCNYS